MKRINFIKNLELIFSNLDKPYEIKIGASDSEESKKSEFYLLKYLNKNREYIKVCSIGETESTQHIYSINEMELFPTYLNYEELKKLRTTVNEYVDTPLFSREFTQVELLARKIDEINYTEKKQATLDYVYIYLEVSESGDNYEISFTRKFRRFINNREDRRDDYKRIMEYDKALGAIKVYDNDCKHTEELFKILRDFSKNKLEV